MNLNLLKSFAAFIAWAVLNQGFAQEVYFGADARKHFSNAQMVRTSQYSSAPSYIRFAEDKQLDLDNFQNWVIKNFQMTPGTDFKLISTESDQLGHKHYRYQQVFSGKTVEAAVWIVHASQDRIYAMNGLLFPSINGASNPGITENAALNYALEHIDAVIYKWQLPEEEAHVKRETVDATATYYPTGELVYVSQSGTYSPESYKLAYKFNIYAHEPVSRTEIYVDASSGTILFENEVFHNIDVVGTAQTSYSGSQPITADSFGGGYRLRESGRGNGVNTYDMNTGTSYGASVDFTDADNNWNNVNANLDQYATDAHWGAEMTYDYYWLVHNRNSIDGNGFALNSYVHYDVNYANAFWDGQRMTYGDGDNSWDPLTAIDIAGHEITHGLTTFSADLDYNAESGALNESFSDIFGTAIEHYALPSNWDWLIGEDIGSALRSMSNPNGFGDPDTYFGNNWASLTGGDNGGVHTNSSVQNYWYYLLVSGGSGTNDNGDSYSITGIGFDDASDIAFRNLTVYLTPSSNFADARFYAIQSAVDLFGGCTPEVEAVTNAWYAVGVGPAYVSAVIADMTAPITNACSAPFTVDFSNLSINGTSFQWNFGDGNTSANLNPTHTYSALGDYTITLIADGGLCGIDTTVWVDFISIDSVYPCEVIMPSSGVANMQTACAGTIYDSGGPAGNYGANEDAQVTIAPIGAGTVDIDFTVFDVEAGQNGNCNYDYVRVYDGPGTSSPLIDTYCNNNVPTVVSSTGGSITIVFHSDGGVEDAGYVVNWNCVLPTTPPNADFTANVDTTCNGDVTFTDLSTNGPSQWFWDFGDGNSSAAQNPQHNYNTSGLYTVSLTSTNLNGSDVATYTNLIFVDLPAAPAATGDNICQNNNANLSATGTGGTLDWYDAQIGGSLVNTGTTYTTPVLTTTTSFWVEELIPGATQYVGPADNTFGGGGFFNGDQHLVFDVASPVTLKTVKVYANGAGNRFIELRSSSGVVLQSATVFIPNGEQVITLDFNLPVGTDLQLGTQAGSNQDLYRNNSGPSFPYVVGGGEVTITQSSPGTGYYYFFYDWEIQSPDCVSERAEVIATVTPGSDATITPVAPLCSGDAAINLTAVDPGGTWSGTGVSGTTFDPQIAGNGAHIITYTIPGSCGDTDQINVSVADSYDATINPVSTLCDNGTPINLSATDAGGTWSGTGITNGSSGEFDPTLAGIGTHTIMYTITGTCGDTDQLDIDVQQGVDATILPTNILCNDGGIVTLSSVETGGVWSGTGITNPTTGEFDPTLAGQGTHTITYSITGTCSDTDTEDVVVETKADASINPAGPFCRYQSTQQLSSVTTGGSWSADCGTCINTSTGVFDPASAGPGNWLITYSLGGNCPSQDTMYVLVEECLGINESEIQLGIYPNPSNGQFKITLNELLTLNLVITDATGRKVMEDQFTGQTIFLDLTDKIAEGSYFLTIYSSEESFRLTRQIQIIR